MSTAADTDVKRMFWSWTACLCKASLHGSVAARLAARKQAALCLHMTQFGRLGEHTDYRNPGR